jgi:glycerol-3-phosphate dehydrogenase
MRLWPVLLGASTAVAIAGPAVAGDFSAAITRLAETDVKLWINHPTIIDAIRAQNIQNARLSTEDILRLDERWRAETVSPSKPMIQALMANALSSFLMQKKHASKGLYTEIFVMDDKGLNVGQSDITSDYWQGDEAKWQKTFLVGPNAMLIETMKRDKSTHILQSQLSLPVTDPATGDVIGAITVGIDVSRLPR